jgi:hypothetical protein
VSFINDLEEYILRAASNPQKRKLPAVFVDSLIDAGAIEASYTDGTLGALTKPLNVAIANRFMTSDLSSEDRRGLSCIWVKQTSVNEIRGRVPFARSVCRVSVGMIGTSSQVEMIATSNDEKRWRVFNRWNSDISSDTFDSDDKHKARLDSVVGVAIGFQCFSEYCWTVQLSFESNAQPIAVNATSEMLDALLSVRDVPPNRSKVQRVIHEVTSHKRGGRQVSAHMRGYTDHLYQGCLMRVVPPVNSIAKLPDTKRGAELKAQFVGGAQ